MSEAINRIEAAEGLRRVTETPVQRQVATPPPRSSPSSARSWSWQSDPGDEKAKAGATRRASRAPAPASTSCWIRAASWRSVRWPRRRADPERALRRRCGDRSRHHRRPPGRRVQPRPDRVPGLGRRDVRPQGRQADGVQVAMVACPIIGITRFGGSAHPGHRDPRRPGTPSWAAATRCAARPGPGDLADLRQVRRWCGVPRRSRPISLWAVRDQGYMFITGTGRRAYSATSPARMSPSMHSAAPSCVRSAAHPPGGRVGGRPPTSTCARTT